MPRVQFTILRLMIVVAIFAMILGAGIEALRLKRFRARCMATAEAQKEQFALRMQRRLEDAVMHDHLLESLRLSDFAEMYTRALARYHDQAVHFARLAQYHSALKEKYQRAAKRPWLVVAPDGPEPAKP